MVSLFAWNHLQPTGFSAPECPAYEGPTTYPYKKVAADVLILKDGSGGYHSSFLVSPWMRHFTSSLTPHTGFSDQKQFLSDEGQLPFTMPGSLWTSASSAIGEPLVPFSRCATRFTLLLTLLKPTVMKC